MSVICIKGPYPGLWPYRNWKLCSWSVLTSEIVGKKRDMEDFIDYPYLHCNALLPQTGATSTGTHWKELLRTVIGLWGVVVHRR